jgi:hypothetical protein
MPGRPGSPSNAVVGCVCESAGGHMGLIGSHCVYPPFSSFHPFLSSTNFYRDCAMLDCTGKGAVQIPIERGEGYLLGCMGGNIFRLDHS